MAEPLSASQYAKHLQTVDNLSVGEMRPTFQPTLDGGCLAEKRSCATEFRLPNSVQRTLMA